MLLSLIVGVGIGAYGMNSHIAAEQNEADNKQIRVDNKKASEIESETAQILDSSDIPEAIVKWKTKTVKIPRDLTDEEIDTLCVNRNIPPDLLQLVRHQVTAARERIDRMRTERSSTW